MKCFYHNDLDGEASAAIVYKELVMGGQIGEDYDPNDLIPVSYNRPFPFEVITPNEGVFILDYSLQSEGGWERLLDITGDVVWIDHHKQSIIDAEGTCAEVLAGIRKWEGVANCELTWHWFHPGLQNVLDPIDDSVPPIGIRMIGDVDCWRFTFGDASREFFNGLITGWDTRPQAGFIESWCKILVPPHLSHPFVDEVRDLGRRVIAKRKIDNEEDLSTKGFEVQFEGMRGIAVNRDRTGADYFASRALDYDVLVAAFFDGEVWSVSLYAPPHRQDLQLGALAKKYGGSGHPGAAGFQCKELPFEIIGRVKG